MSLNELNTEEAYADIDKVLYNLKEAKRLIREAEDLIDKYDIVGLDVLSVFTEQGLNDAAASYALSGKWKQDK